MRMVMQEDNRFPDFYGEYFHIQFFIAVDGQKYDFAMEKDGPYAKIVLPHSGGGLAEIVPKSGGQYQWLKSKISGIKGISECEQVEWLIHGVNAYDKICRILIREGAVI